jgi:hypothetical protein
MYFQALYDAQMAVIQLGWVLEPFLEPRRGSTPLHDLGMPA